MKKYLLIIVTVCFTTICATQSCTQDKKSSYYFDEKGISRAVLEHYLDKSMTITYFLSPELNPGRRAFPYFDDNVRLVKNTGAKFIGRAIYRWGLESYMNDASFLGNARKIIAEMHLFDPEIVFQACIFEIITTDVNKVSIPAWVFEDYGLPVEERHFSYDAMLNDKGVFVNHWRENSSVPDVTKKETQLWFYFLARSYIDVGCEAFHIGQIELIGMNDPDRTAWAEILTKIRGYASKNARRKWVLIDAHVPRGGMVKDGVSLLDFNSFPLRIKEIPENPHEGKLEINHLDGIYKKSHGCITPSGWSCEHLPYLVEFDNFGRGNKPNEVSLNSPFIWGWDEISWLSLQPAEYRDKWIKYAFDWLRENDPDGHLEMPGCRMITCPNETNGYYRANTKSDDCPDGYSQEETIKAIYKSLP
jgi:hypothetical protein